MEKHRNDLAKFAIANSSEFGLPIPSHFSPSTFTGSAFDNFDHVDKNMLSVKSGSHDTVITLFQEIPTKKEMKRNRSEVNLATVKTLSKLDCQELVPFSMEKLYQNHLEKLYQNHLLLKQKPTIQMKRKMITN